MQVIRKFLQDEAGAAAVEYALLVALIAVALIITITALSTSIQNTFTKASTALTG